MTKVLEEIGTVRDFINSPRKQHLLLAERADWNKLCSSLDAVGDTELAIESYLTTVKPESHGEVYLTIYGILQVLFVQQDAVGHIAESLSLHSVPDPLLSEIREIRNDSVGHPTKRGSGKGVKFNFINRSSMSPTGFQLLTTFADKVQPKFTQISIPDLIDTQRTKLAQLLSEVVIKLRDEEMEHKKQFQNEKLANILHHNIDYCCEKIYETLWGNLPHSFGAGMLDQISKFVSEFKEALKRRGLLGALDSVTHILNELEYPLAKLKTYFTEGGISDLSDKDALIFVFFIREHIKELRDIAKEIDLDYESNS